MKDFLLLLVLFLILALTAFIIVAVGFLFGPLWCALVMFVVMFIAFGITTYFDRKDGGQSWIC